MKQVRIKQVFTNRDEQSIERYFIDVDKYKPLTHEEEIICAQGIRAGDYKSFEKLINSNLRFVISVAKQYQNSSIPLPDLINSGNEGLVLAAKKFDETKGFKFISYAVWWVRQSIIKNIQDNSKPIRLVSNKAQLLSKYKKIEDAYIQEHGEIPSVDFVSKKLDIDHDSAEEILSLSKIKFTSLDSTVDGEDDSAATHADLLEDSESLKNVQRNLNKESLRKDLINCISRLSEKEKYVLTKVFNLDGGGEMSLEAIGKDLGLSKERIRQLRDSGIHRISNSRNKNILVNYL
jgi:RNA polymerase primary sigma factor